MHADQIYTYLVKLKVKLKLNFRIWPNSNCENTFYGYKLCITAVGKKKTVPTRKTNGMYLIKNREHSSIPTQPGTAF